MKNIFYILTLSIFAFISCKNEADDPQPDTDTSTGIADDAQIWNGPNITFTKASGANPNDESNQDRLTDNVWLTRGNNGGQLFNAKVENSSTKATSPAGTKWAIGKIDDISNLTFKPFREALVKPQNVVNQDLVLFLEEDNTYVALKITSWASGKAGGFTYERSTKP